MLDKSNSPVAETALPCDNKGPLAGLIVLDFTTALAGPLCTYYLAGLGATIIKIEPPKVGDPVRGYAPFVGPNGVSMTKDEDDAMSLSILNRGRGKKSMTLNLKAPGALALYRKLVARADIVVENYASGTADRLGIGYEATRAIKPSIIYCSLSGFGVGAYPGKKAMDAVVQALSGVMMTSGKAGDPPVRVGIPVADTVAPLFAVMGINAALYRRSQTGLGEHVDVSMLGSLTALLAVEDWQAMDKLGYPSRTGNTLSRLSPFGTYRCNDGYVSIVAGGRDHMAHALFKAMGKPEMAEDPRYAKVAARATRDDEMTMLIEEWTTRHSVDEIVASLEAHGVGNAPVRTPAQALEEVVVNERREVLTALHPELGEISGLKTAGLPITLRRSETGYGNAAPRLGQDNDLVLRQWLGLSTEEIATLESDGAFS